MKFTREQIAKALKLYVITDRSWLKEDETLLSVCEKVIQNGATFLQLREKELGAEETRKEAIELQKLCRRYNIPFVVNDSVEIALQIGGKLRGKMQVAINASKEEAITQAKEALASRLEGKTVVKEIYVPGKIINLIVK